MLLAVLVAAGLLALAPALTRRYDATERVAAERATSTARVLSRRRRRRTVPGPRPVNPPRFRPLCSLAFAFRLRASVGPPRRRPSHGPAPPAAGLPRPDPAQPDRTGRGRCWSDPASGSASRSVVHGAAGRPGLPAPARGRRRPPAPRPASAGPAGSPPEQAAVRREHDRRAAARAAAVRQALAERDDARRAARRQAAAYTERYGPSVATVLPPARHVRSRPSARRRSSRSWRNRVATVTICVDGAEGSGSRPERAAC